MASEWLSFSERRRRQRRLCRARKARSSWTAAGAAFLQQTPSAGSRVAATQIQALPRPLPPLAGRWGEEGRAALRGWGGRRVVRAGGVEWEAAVRWGGGEAQRPRGTRARSELGAPRGVRSAGWASGNRAPLSQEWGASARRQHRGRAGKGGDRNSSPPALWTVSPRQLPELSEESAVRLSRDPGSGSGGGWLGAGAAATGCALAPGSGTYSSLPYIPSGWLPPPHLPQGSALSPGSQAQGPVLHSPILSVGCCFPQRPASIPDLRGQAKATSLLSLDPCSELPRSPAGPRLSPRRPQSPALAPAASFLVRGIPHFSGPLGA